MKAMRYVAGRGLAVLAIVAGAHLPLGAHAAVSFQVTFSDPGSAYSGYYDRIRNNVVAAGKEWAGHLGSAYTASLQIQVSFADLATASGVSVTNWYVGESNGYSTYEQGAAYEILTGKDPNGSTPDIRMTIGRNGYLQNELWFDPSPTKQTTAVPLSRTDARSIFLHELGHAIVFNGWRDARTGTLPGGYQSTFDNWVRPSTVNGKTQLFFTGPSAMSLYGGPVPLTLGNYGHLGNLAPGPGSNLLTDLMNGVSFARGTRYHVSPFDLAILNDTGIALPTQLAGMGFGAIGSWNAAAPMPVAVPEPSVWGVMVGGLVVIAYGRRRMRWLGGAEAFTHPAHEAWAAAAGSRSSRKTRRLTPPSRSSPDSSACGFGTALRAFTSLREVSLRRNPRNSVRLRRRRSAPEERDRHSTVTLFAKLRGLSTSVPLAHAV